MDISEAFSAQSYSIYDFFTRAKKDESLGFSIPQYQRPYSWDSENIEQLIDDICQGSMDFLKDSSEIHFMGTIITISSSFYDDLQDVEKRRARPKNIEDIIDGQQRLSTIALLACCLYKRVLSYSSQLPDSEKFYSLQEAAEDYLLKLSSLFSYKTKRQKNIYQQPILVRESQDEWNFSVEVHPSSSEIYQFLHKFVREIQEGTLDTEKESIFIETNEARENIVLSNVAYIQGKLHEVEIGNEFSNFQFPDAESILTHVNQDELWDEKRYDSIDNFLESEHLEVAQKLIRMLMFSYFLLKRCCFTSIVPASELRAFDMFQSLNATGTRLTAIETFKPLIVNSCQDYETSISRQYFSEVEKLFDRIKTSSGKDTRNNQFLTFFENSYSGEKLGKQFSKQRKMLVDYYKECQSTGDGNLFLWKLGRAAQYCKQFIFSESQNLITSLIDEIASSKLSKLAKEASFCMLYLKDAKHILAHTLILRFYAVATKEGASLDARRDFLESCKAMAAFFTLWRSAFKGTYPDGEYRKYIRKSSRKENLDSFHWHENNEISLSQLKAKLRDSLASKIVSTVIADSEDSRHKQKVQKGLLDLELKDLWLRKAVKNLTYDNSLTVCRFALFIAAHDTIPDKSAPGLMKPGKSNVAQPYIDPQQWGSENLATVEHIAPQRPKNKSDWDEKLYEDSEFNFIGNLTLLPQPINSSAANKSWKSKSIYYSYLAETDPDNLPLLKDKARKLFQESGDHDEESHEKLCNRLEKCEFSNHIIPLVQRGENSDWSFRFVEQRSTRICEILYDRMCEWLSE
jgi:hypothetical protein